MKRPTSRMKQPLQGRCGFFISGRGIILISVEEKKMKKEEKCDDCGGTDYELDTVRGERVCSCGLVSNIPLNDAQTNSNSALGDGRTHEVVDSLAKEGERASSTRMNPNDKYDAHGKLLTSEQRKSARRRAWADRNSQRESDPMFRLLVSTIKEIFSEDIAKAAILLASATARKLTRLQESKRRTLSPGEKALLKCPKTSITRKPDGIKGSSDRENLLIMALAIGVLAHEWFRTAPINRQLLMDRYGITEAQFKNAKATISKHYKARVRQEWAQPPAVLHRAALRADQLDMAVDNLIVALSSRFSSAEMDAIMETFWGMLTGIGEPSLEAHTGNVPVNMVAACVMFAALDSLGVSHQNLACIARAVSLSGAGVKSRLQVIKDAVEAGLFAEGVILFEKKSGSEEDASEEGAEEGVEE